MFLKRLKTYRKIEFVTLLAPLLFVHETEGEQWVRAMFSDAKQQNLGYEAWRLEEAVHSAEWVLLNQPNSRQTKNLLALGYQELGRFMEASKVYAALRSHDSTARLCQRQLQLSTEINQSLPEDRRVLQICQLNTVSWAVLTGRFRKGDELGDDDLDFEICQYDARPGNKLKNQSTLRLSDSDVFHSRATLLRHQLDGKAGAGLVIEIAHGAANGAPTRIICLRWNGNKFQTVGEFDSALGPTFRVCPKSGELLFGMNAVRKLYWTDWIERLDHRWVFANPRHPELFPRPTLYLQQDDARVWLELGAWHAIHREWDHAIIDLRIAEWWLKKDNSREDDDERHYWSPTETTEDTLPDVRVKLRWLRKQDYNHWRLYRPGRALLPAESPFLKRTSR